MKNRILEFLRVENKTSAQFAEEIGVQPSGISHIISGRNKPSLDFVLKMLERYKYINPEWLLFGKGKMYREQSLPDLFSQIQEQDQEQDSARNRDISVEKVTLNDTSRLENSKLHDDTAKLSVEKIVWFYNNNSFREYYPEKE